MTKYDHELFDMDFLGVKYHLPPPHSTPPPHAHLPGARALKMNFWETEKVDMQYPPQAAAFFAEGCRVFMGCRHPCINWPAVQAWHHGHSTDKESKMAPSAPVRTIQAGISNSAFFPQVKGVQILCMCNCFIYFWKCMCFWASSSLKEGRQPGHMSTASSQRAKPGNKVSVDLLSVFGDRPCSYQSTWEMESIMKLLWHPWSPRMTGRRLHFAVDIKSPHLRAGRQAGK